MKTLIVLPEAVYYFAEGTKEQLRTIAWFEKELFDALKSEFDGYSVDFVHVRQNNEPVWRSYEKIYLPLFYGPLEPPMWQLDPWSHHRYFNQLKKLKGVSVYFYAPFDDMVPQKLDFNRKLGIFPSHKYFQKMGTIAKDYLSLGKDPNKPKEEIVIKPKVLKANFGVILSPYQSARYTQEEIKELLIKAFMPFLPEKSLRFRFLQADEQFFKRKYFASYDGFVFLGKTGTKAFSDLLDVSFMAPIYKLQSVKMPILTMAEHVGKMEVQRWQHSALMRGSLPDLPETDIIF